MTVVFTSTDYERASIILQRIQSALDKGLPFTREFRTTGIRLWIRYGATLVSVENKSLNGITLLSIEWTETPEERRISILGLIVDGLWALLPASNALCVEGSVLGKWEELERNRQRGWLVYNTQIGEYMESCRTKVRGQDIASCFGLVKGLHVLGKVGPPRCEKAELEIGTLTPENAGLLRAEAVAEDGQQQNELLGIFASYAEACNCAKVNAQVLKSTLWIRSRGESEWVVVRQPR